MSYSHMYQNGTALQALLDIGKDMQLCFLAAVGKAVMDSSRHAT